MKQTRQQLIDQVPASPFKDYEKIKCAWPTDMHTRSAMFDELADFNLMAIRNFNREPTPDSYNTIVASCITCHQQSCPGPMAAIRPLVLETGETLKPLEETPAEACETPAKN